MGYEVTGFARSLTILIYKRAYGSVVSGYPKTYDGKTNIDFLAYYSPLYSSITEDEMAKLSVVDFNTRVDDFKSWLELIEPGLDFDTASIMEEARISSDDCTTTTTFTSTSSSTTTTTTTSECECNSSMTVGSYIQGEYVSVGYGRDGMPPMDFSVMGSISPDCWNVVALCHNTYYTSKSILLILRNYPCCESIIVEINGVEYTLLFSLQNDIYCSYILSGVDNPFPEEGQICNIAICETSCTTTTTAVEPTTTTTTTTLLCEHMICDTTLTVGTDGDGNYGFLRGLAGSISPDCGSVNVVGYMDSQGLLGVVLIDYVCDVTLWINGVEYELTYFGYVPAYGGNAYFISLVPNPLPSVGETCNVAICGTECTTTTTTVEPTTTTTTIEPTTTSTTTEELTTTTTTSEPITTTTTTTTIESYDFCVEYGALYNWYAATDERNIAPAGWHVPIYDEWSNLQTQIGGQSYGGTLKEIGFTYWNTPNTGATNTSGFSARGGGQRKANGDYMNNKYICIFHTGDNFISSNPTAILSYDNGNLVIGGSTKDNSGYSLRLLKDNQIDTGTMVGNDGKVYPTVTIGTQVWMAANLAETKYRNGDLISNHGETYTDKYTDAEWAALTTEAMCYYDNDISYAGEVGECPTTTTTTTTTSP